jgi:hypothetical protein
LIFKPRILVNLDKNEILMKLLTTLMLLFCFTNGKAQGFLRDILGRPIIELAFVDIIGSPFQNDEFLKGSVILHNDDEYENVPLKYNIYDDELYFKSTKDEMLLSFVIPVKSFMIGGQTYLNGFPEIENFTKTSYYGLLADKKIKLLFKAYKTIAESRPYNSPRAEKRFESYKAYFILKGGKMYRFKPSKKDLINLFDSSGPKIEEYIRKEKINFKNDQDLIKIIDFINSL